MNRSLILKIVLFLALIQGIAALVRAMGWVQIGADLFGQGVLLLPFLWCDGGDAGAVYRGDRSPVRLVCYRRSQGKELGVVDRLRRGGNQRFSRCRSFRTGSAGRGGDGLVGDTRYLTILSFFGERTQRIKNG